MSKGKRAEILRVDEIQVVGKRRRLNQHKCQLIAESIRAVGLRTPITVHAGKNGGIGLVAGRHRLEAMKLLGKKEIECFIVKDKKLKRELWQDGENEWKASRTALERAEAIARLTRNFKKLGKGDANTAAKGGEQPHDKGVSKGARKSGHSRETVRRAVTIDAISPAAKKAAKASGLDRKQDALLKIAKAATPEAQAQKVHDLTTKQEREPYKPSSAERKQLKNLRSRLRKAEKLRRAISKASPHVLRMFAREIVKLGHSARSTKSKSA
jgi:ParB family transcriptional regulator, chromosome partitioning protein